MRKRLCIVLAGLLLFGCEENYLPKPTGYNRIDLPPHDYQGIGDAYSYQIAVSKYAQVEADSFNLGQKDWINLNYTDFGAKVHLTYMPIDGDKVVFKQLSNDAFKLTAKHQVKAYGIEESVLVTPEGYTGVAAELSGEVPTQFQFFVTDSTDNFLRGALYFNTAMKNDSLSPVIEYIKVDMAHLMNSVKFEN
ncbi:gliding motility lipoprotein GldD [Algoriphagus halophytocola]|uniref:Gliding motility lipoprotein GldD n=1 Tax=Algoriphagus halophytocola TaxID=2991499 RepID=A0ABY6MH36_9BACT|nr:MULTISPECIES: gliding motility lipoprotein GldD [unclassified Algoriphagus]UZD21976.1 gliding motility lipoprotein GldD [Algoriphagus sp. TR-M5]WBL43227.1 gliding motility lipoprotein GldD [Algoriphagus sp. TR-M9]